MGYFNWFRGVIAYLANKESDMDEVSYFRDLSVGCRFFFYKSYLVLRYWMRGDKMMRIACAQVRAKATEPEVVLRDLDQLAARAAQEGAQLLITPEMYLSGYNIGVAEVRHRARAVDGAYYEAVSQIARDQDLAILYGYPELGEDGVIYNSAQLVDETGKLILNYRKTHLYGDVDKAQFSAGDRRSEIAMFHGWKVALAICYDVEFPELLRAYARDGAEIVLVPTANMLPYTGVATRLVPARAEENGFYVAYCNYVGTEGVFEYCGLSCVCGPDGTDRARADQSEQLIIADLNRDDVAKCRTLTTYLSDIRDEIYK